MAITAVTAGNMMCPRPESFSFGHAMNALDRINAGLNETRDDLHREIQRTIAEQEKAGVAKP